MVCGKCEAKSDDIELYCKKCGADLQIHFSGATPVLALGVEAGGGEVQEREEEPAAVTTPAEIEVQREETKEVQREETKESAQPVFPPYSPSEVEAGAAETTQEAKEVKPDTQPEKPAWERFSQEGEEEKLAKKHALSEDEEVSTLETDKAKKGEEEEEGPRPVGFDFEEEELEG